MLVVGFSDKNTLQAIDSSLRPDNIKFPQGMKLKQTRRGNELRISINLIGNEDKTLETLISTLDEIVLHIQSGTSAIEKTERI